MSKSRDVKRLKIVEQIIVVLLLAVIVPTVVSAIIINNINQHSVRAELQYSAMSICESIASNIETFAKSGDDELNQIVVSLKHIKSDYAREVYMKDLLINSDLILNLELVNKSDKDRYLEWKDYSTINRKKGTIEVLKKLNDGQAIIATIDDKVFENQVFNIYKNDDRQIYILGSQNNLVASHNYNEKEFENIMSVLPKNLKVGQSVIFGKVKNQPLAYFKSQEPQTTVIVNTTHKITNTTINTARTKILLAVSISALFIIFVVGLYTYYLYINIRQLFKGIMALSLGNYTRKVRLLTNVFTPYEIVFLAMEFNEMADEINNAYRQLKQSNKELKKLDELRSNLIDTVSHEFRTPLTSIK